MNLSSAGNNDVLSMLWTRILDHAISSSPGKPEETLVRNPDGLDSSVRQMVLHLLLELRGTVRILRAAGSVLRRLGYEAGPENSA